MYNLVVRQRLSKRHEFFDLDVQGIFEEYDQDAGGGGGHGLQLEDDVHHHPVLKLPCRPASLRARITSSVFLVFEWDPNHSGSLEPGRGRAWEQPLAGQSTGGQSTGQSTGKDLAE